MGDASERMARTLSVLQHYNLLGNAKLSDVSITILCPFHEEHTPSCSISVVKGAFYCFGCGASGTIVDLVAKLEHTDALHALRIVQKIHKGNKHKLTAIEFTIEEHDAEQLQQEAYDFFYSLPKPSWDVITNNYMLSRGFTRKVLRHFDVRINQSSTYPIIIPLFERKHFRGYVCRRVDNETADKYRYNKGFSRHSVVVGRMDKDKPVLVVEGIMDLMKAYQYGYPNVCALLGWKCTAEQAKKLAKRAPSIICGLDNDEHGDQGYRELKEQLDMPVVRLPIIDVKDVGEMTQRQFDKAITRALSKL